MDDGDELHSITTGGIIEGTQPRGRPRTRYISQIIKDAQAGHLLQGPKRYGEWQGKTEKAIVVVNRSSGKKKQKIN